MKKLISTVLIVSSLGHSSSSQAGLAIASADVPLIVVGALTVGAGVAGSAVGFSDCVGNSDHIGCVVGEFLLGFPSLAVATFGLVVLKDGQTATTRFGELNSAEATTLGVSEADRQKYNSNLDELNQIVDQISSQVAPIDNANETLTTARTLWAQYESDLDPSAVSVARKISAQVQVSREKIQ